jgi:hypothetical protein
MSPVGFSSLNFTAYIYVALNKFPVKCPVYAGILWKKCEEVLGDPQDDAFKGTLTQEILPLVFFIRARPLTP